MTPEAQLPIPRQDPMVLHFLKELPAWCIIAIFVGAFLAVWNLSHDDFIPRIIDGLVGALLTSIVAQRPKAPTTIKTDNVTTDTVTTETMDNAQITADTITSAEKEK